MKTNLENLADQFLTTSAKLRRIISQCSNTSLEEKIATLLQIQALSFLQENPQATVGELSHDLVLSSASTAQLTDRLVIAQRLTRINDPKDRRVTRLQLTELGKTDLQKMKEQYIKKISQLLTYISESDLQELVRIQTELSQKLEKLNK